MTVRCGHGPVRSEANMPNDDAKADPDIAVTDELDPADVAVITDGLRGLRFEPDRILRFSPARCVRPRSADRQGRRRAPRTVRIRARLCRLVLSARGFAPRPDR